MKKSFTRAAPCAGIDQHHQQHDRQRDAHPAAPRRRRPASPATATGTPRAVLRQRHRDVGERLRQVFTAANVVILAAWLVAASPPPSSAAIQPWQLSAQRAGGERGARRDADQRCTASHRVDRGSCRRRIPRHHEAAGQARRVLQDQQPAAAPPPIRPATPVRTRRIEPEAARPAQRRSRVSSCGVSARGRARPARQPPGNQLGLRLPGGLDALAPLVAGADVGDAFHRAAHQARRDLVAGHVMQQFLAGLHGLRPAFTRPAQARRPWRPAARLHHLVHGPMRRPPPR